MTAVQLAQGSVIFEKRARESVLNRIPGEACQGKARDGEMARGSGSKRLGVVEPYHRAGQ